MHRFIAAACAALFIVPAALADDRDQPKWALVVHGGAGVIERETMTPEKEATYRAAMSRALETGSHVPANGGRRLARSRP